MPRLYIANCTNQTRKVYYRLDVDKNGALDPNDRFRAAREISIPAGKGASLGDLHQGQITSIIEQLAPIGARQANDTGNLPKHRVPYLLSSDKPISAALIMKVYRHNIGLLTSQGKQRRINAAIASNEVVSRHIEAEGKMKNFELEIEQQPVEAGEAEPVGKPVEEGYRVQAPEDKSETRAQRRRAAAAKG